MNADPQPLMRTQIYMSRDDGGDLLGLELGEVGGALLRSPVSMQANTAAKSKLGSLPKILYIARHFHTYVRYSRVMDQISIKTPNPKCRLDWCLIEFIDWRYRQSCWYFRPLL